MKNKLVFLRAVCLITIAILTRTSVTLAQPKPVPYIFHYELGIPGSDEAIRAKTALHEFTRKSNAEGWSVESEEIAYTRHVLVLKERNRTIEDLVVNQLKGCEIFDSNCKRYIENLNHRVVDDLAQLDTFEGEITLPAQASRYKVTVNPNNSKNHYMEESVAVTGQTQFKLVAIMTVEFNQALTPLHSQIISGWASFCNGDGCIQLYELKVQ